MPGSRHGQQLARRPAAPAQRAVGRDRPARGVGVGPGVLGGAERGIRPALTIRHRPHRGLAGQCLAGDNGRLAAVQQALAGELEQGVRAPVYQHGLRDRQGGYWVARRGRRLVRGENLYGRVADRVAGRLPGEVRIGRRSGHARPERRDPVIAGLREALVEDLRCDVSVGFRADVVADQDVPHSGSGQVGGEAGHRPPGLDGLLDGVQQDLRPGSLVRHLAAVGPGRGGQWLQRVVGGRAPGELAVRVGRHDQRGRLRRMARQVGRGLGPVRRNGSERPGRQRPAGKLREREPGQRQGDERRCDGPPGHQPAGPESDRD